MLYTSLPSLRFQILQPGWPRRANSHTEPYGRRNLQGFLSHGVPPIINFVFQTDFGCNLFKNMSAYAPPIRHSSGSDSYECYNRRPSLIPLRCLGANAEECSAPKSPWRPSNPHFSAVIATAPTKYSSIFCNVEKSVFSAMINLGFRFVNYGVVAAAVKTSPIQPG